MKELGLRSCITSVLTALIAGMILAAMPATAQQVTLKAANAFPEGSYFAQNFERFIKKVNEEGKGLVQINYIGGPAAIPTFELANALRLGVVDLANTTTSYTASIVPEGLALNYTDLSMADMRRNGIMDYLNTFFLAKGLYYYARTGEGVPYYIFTNKKIENGQLAGLRLRSAPIYRDFFNKVGINGVQLAPGEVYSALERGVIDGYAWPLMGIFDFGWQRETHYRVEPGFYAIELGIIFNANSLKRLTKEQRAFLDKQATWIENLTVNSIRTDAPREIKRQEEAGIKVIRLEPQQAKQMKTTAYGAAWDALVAESPAGAKLRGLMEPK